jgi:1,2-diacylglycerol 3-alpha-glucosyltransferase
VRIGVFTDTYLPAMDGVVKSLLLYNRELERLGHEVHVFAPATTWKGESHEGNVHRFRSIEIPFYEGYRLCAFPSSLDRLATEARLDIVHLHGFASMGLKGLGHARQHKVPAVFTFHTMVDRAFGHYFMPGVRPWIWERLYWAYIRWMLRRCALVLYPTEWTRGDVEGRADAKFPSALLPSGFDPEVNHPPSSPPSGRQLVLYVGRVAHEKGLDLALRSVAALAKEERPRFVIVGKGPAREELAGLALGLGVEAEFTGFVPEAELAEWYRRASLLLMPSEFETQGLVAVEAMASGTPVVARRHGAFASLIKEGENGAFFDTPAEGAEAVRKVLASRERFSRGAMEASSEYDIRTLARRLVSIYESLLNGSSPAPRPSPVLAASPEPAGR